MSENSSLKLGELLVSEGLLTEDQLSQVLEFQRQDNRKLGQILVDKKYITEQQLTESLARAFELPLVDLSDISIDPQAFSVFSHDILFKYQVLPIEIDEQCLTLVTNNPLDVAAIQELQYMSGHQIRLVMASLSDILEHIHKYTESINTLQAIKNAGDEGSREKPILELVDSILTRAVKERASDIHFEPMGDRMRVRLRVDGVLHEEVVIPKELERRVISRIKIISGMDVAEARKPQDGRMSVPGMEDKYDVRVSTLPDIHGENLVLRLLNKQVSNQSFAALGMDAHEITIMQSMIERPYGMILVTGPTGAGKTTTLYAALKLLNNVSKNIITVEDPVEYKLEGINQTAINNLAGYTFATAIRHILRHDPDIIMVGEIRDVETAEIAIRAALTGHLVLATLHTNNAAGAITRLLDMGIEPFLISSSVIGVVAQRLLRRLCPACRAEYTPDDEVQQSIREYIPDLSTPKLAKHVGCKQCFRTGYKGRVGIYEILPLTSAIRRLVVKEPSDDEIMQAAVPQGMKTLRRAGIEKALDLQTSYEEVMRITFVEGRTP